VTELLLSRLLGCIHYPPQSLDVLIIDQFTDLILLGKISFLSLSLFSSSSSIAI
jgi:hypothetical protein